MERKEGEKIDGGRGGGGEAFAQLDGALTSRGFLP